MERLHGNKTDKFRNGESRLNGSVRKRTDRSQSTVDRLLLKVHIDMTPRRWYKLKQFSSLMGVFFMLTPTGLTWYWGNIIVYTDSYYRYTQGPNGAFVSSWVLSLYMMLWTLGIPVSERVERLLGSRFTQILSAVMFNAAIYLSYFALRFSQIALILTISLLGGSSSGWVYGLMLKVITEWTDKNTGLVTAALSVGYTGGSIIVNQFITRLVNPDNYVPDVESGPRKYFTQKDLIARVPSLFIALGIYCSICHVLGLLLVFRNEEAPNTPKKNARDNNNSKVQAGDDGGEEGYEEKEPMLKSDDGEEEEEENGMTDTNGLLQPQEKELRSVATLDLTPDDNLSKGSDSDSEPEGAGKSHKPTNGVGFRNGAKSKAKNGAPPSRDEEEEGEEDRPQTTSYYKYDLKPSEMLRTCTFYVMWLNLICADMSYIVMVNNYKAFGQVYIHDDHFLANMSFFISMSVLFMKPLWGLLIDRKGVKVTAVCILSTMSLIVSFWYFTPRVGRWLYALCTSALGAAATGVYLEAFVGTLKLFGKKHFVANFGFAISSGMVANFCAPTLLEFLAHTYGWFVLFAFISGLSAFGLLIVVCKMPNV